jgi:hypothetical protein
LNFQPITIFNESLEGKLPIQQRVQKLQGDQPARREREVRIQKYMRRLRRRSE